MSKGIRSVAVAEQLLSVEAAAERLDTTPRSSKQARFRR